MSHKNVLTSTLMFFVFASTVSALAQNSSPEKKSTAKTSVTNNGTQGSTDDFVELLRKDVRSEKKQIIAQNMDLSDDEAVKFWQVYDRYAADLSRIYDTKLALLSDYADNYSSMTGEQAENYIRKRADVEQSIMQSATKIHSRIPQGALRQGDRVVLSVGLAAGSGN